MFPNGDMTEVGEKVRLFSVITTFEDMQLTSFHATFLGYIALWWAEAAVKHLSYHLLQH